MLHTRLMSRLLAIELILTFIHILIMGGSKESISRFVTRSPLFKGSGKAEPMRRSELYQKVCSNQGEWMEEARAAIKSVPAGTHSLADFPIYNWELFIYNSFN